MTLRWDSGPRPPAFMVDRFALTTHRRFLGFALRLVRVVLPRSNRSIFVISGKMRHGHGASFAYPERILLLQLFFSSIPQVVTSTSVPFIDRRCSATRQPFNTFASL